MLSFLSRLSVFQLWQSAVVYQGLYSAWKILESTWILFLKFKALESAWKQGRSLKVLEKSLNFWAAVLEK